MDFNEGKRYGDFNSPTDKVAAYGLASLVGVVALGAGAMKLLKGRKQEEGTNA